jgi:ubiquinone/menaquinone biosynthesis C-methylase UbiE
MKRIAVVAFALAAAILSCRRAPETAAPVLVDETHPAEPARKPAAPMSYLGADWLERADREEIEQPERVLDALALQPGDVVADVGAGTGYFSLRIARRVAPGGRVLATDIQPGMLALLKKNIEAAQLTNVVPILATEEDARLPEDAVDLVLMVDVYHELSRPFHVLRQVRKALRAKGRLVLVEYRGEDPEVPIKEEHKMTLAAVRAEVETCGFSFVESLEFLPWQHVIVFRR